MIIFLWTNGEVCLLVLLFDFFNVLCYNLMQIKRGVWFMTIERKIVVIKNKITFCEQKGKHKKILKQLKKELNKLI